MDGFIAVPKMGNGTAHQITQHICYGYALPSGHLDEVRTSYMLETLSEMPKSAMKIKY